MLIIELIGRCGEARKTIQAPEWCQSVSIREEFDKGIRSRVVPLRDGEPRVDRHSLHRKCG